jgi:hypothetical protein
VGFWTEFGIRDRRIPVRGPRTPIDQCAKTLIYEVAACHRRATDHLGFVLGSGRNPRLEAEFVASDVFRSGSLLVRTWKELHFDGQYFGTESVDAGITGFNWEFRWKQFSILPGFGVSFGSGVHTAPMVTLRWKLETRRWFSQGYVTQSLRSQIVEDESTGHTIHATVLDNNHISARLRSG